MPGQNPPLSNGVFHRLTLDEFQELLAQVRLQREVDSVHLHHTWKPRHADFNGVDTIIGMWRFHTQTNGWSDIAQHLSIDPDGGCWTGRHWDRPPASASGHNGSSVSGPFMIEMIGDFDSGQDPFEDPQRHTALSVLALLLDRFDLPTSSIRFHNQMSTKTCPGTSIDRPALLSEVEAMRGARRAVTPAGRSPFSSADVESSLFRAMAFMSAAAAAVPGSRAPFDVVTETLGAEPTESDEIATRGRARLAESALEEAARQARDVDVTLTPAVKESLKPYVVNLRRGKFSSEGEFTTTKEEVDAIFDVHLPKALATAGGRPLHIVFYAHGGLVGEKDGLGVALKHVDWWRANGVYPIYFVWETDLLSSIITVILAELGIQRTAARDALDFFDNQIEDAARRVHANRFWADMKHVAELASALDGGARFVAKRIGDFCKTHGTAVKVHAVGHSAGSNFHGFFLPPCLDAGVPRIETLQFLAPAITVDGFFATLAPKLGSIGPLTMFTMKDSFEQDDNCKRVYNKSLLYLIHKALEDQRETDLLGLEISVRRDLRLRRFFGLEGTPSPKGNEVVWSVTTGDRRSSSESTSHGGFDDDPATMNSVLRHLLGLKGSDDVAQEFVQPVRRADVEAWTDGAAAVLDRAAGVAVSQPAAPPSRGPQPSTAPAGGRGARRALCVGINNYRRSPLRGCVADAERWAATFQALGFVLEPTIPETQATAQRILSALRDLVRRSQAGDVVAFQFAGHGTTLPDRSGDEAGGDSPGQDEALCPYDFTEGQFIVDDELAEVFDDAGDRGVAVTSFIDCCHSGSITRLGEGPATDDTARSADERPRFVEATPSEIARHLERRRGRRAGRGATGRSRAAQRDVLFSACRSVEVAWESNQQGDFTRLATPILREAGQSTHGALLQQIAAAFGANPRQHPELHPAGASGHLLFGGSAGGFASTAAPDRAAAAGTVPQSTEVATLLRAIADLLAK